jgi:Tol biopolymer transport system component/TolB-like protein/Tfp pilus assembly protein PilF
MRETSENTGVLYEFGNFVLDPHERVLLVDGQAIHLSDKVFDTLLLLVKNNGRLLTKNEMMASIWEESFVEESNLSKNISRLRKILNADGVRLIETVPRRGYRFTADVSEIASDTDLLVRRRLRITLTRTHENGDPGTQDPTHATGAIQSIAVLPFQPLDENETNEIFGLGLTDALITQMNRAGQLQVRPTSSILKYNVVHRDPVAAARELNADAVLDGRFQRLGNRLRLTVQLLRAADGDSLWADAFNVDVDDIFAVQDKIAERVLGALSKKFGSEPSLTPVKRDTENVEAYQEYLTGRYYWNKRAVDGYEKALGSYGRAIEIDPEYALAYAGLADVYNLLPFYDGFAPRDYFPKAKSAALKALALDPNLAEAHAALGLVILNYDWNWPGAEVSFRKAIDLNPNLSTPYELLGVYLCRLGRVGEAITALKKAYELDPSSPTNATWLAEVFRHCGQPDTAVELHQRTLECFPDFYLAHYHLAFAYLDLLDLEKARSHSERAIDLSNGNSLTLAQRGILQASSGDRSGVRETLDRLIKLKTERYISSVNVASVLAASHNEQESIAWLESAERERDPNLTWLKFDKEFEFLKDHPGFRRILEEVGLAETERKILPQAKAPRPSRRIFPTAVSLLLVLILGGLFYVWNRQTSAPASIRDPLRLTFGPTAENNPRWTKDGRIRFLLTGSDKRTRSMVMNPDGTNQIEATGIDNLSMGSWSPDETKVIFLKHGEATKYLADADGSNETVLPPVFDGSFDWSPDSKRIVYQSRINTEDSEIFVYHLETGKNEDITNHPAFDADPTFSPDGQQIAFASLRDGNAEIYLMDADGSNVRRLTNHPAWESHPVFSPDGTQIAFNADRDNENGNTYLMNLDGTGIRRLIDWKSGDYVVPGGWSPDGTTIVFSSDGDGNDDISVVSAEVFVPEKLLAEKGRDLGFASYSPDGKLIVFQAAMEDKSAELRTFDFATRSTKVLLKTTNADIAPVFSPDGSSIAFQNRIESNIEICLIEKDGSGLRDISNNAARDADPAFSPDGTKIVFASNRDGNYGIYNLYVMNVDGSDQRLLYANRSGMSVSPVWSVDGKEIVFVNDREGGRVGNFEIYKIGFETPGDETRLTFRKRRDGNPSFSPDGRRIAFSSTTDGNSEIYVMNSDGSGLLRITRHTAEDSSPHWSPDGLRIIFSSSRGGKYAIYEVEL